MDEDYIFYTLIPFQRCIPFFNHSSYDKFKALSHFKVEEVKNLPLDGYQAMLNTRPLGGEWVP
jgi:hypothetical protein